MRQNKIIEQLLFFIILVCGSTPFGFGQNLTLRIDGNEKSGYEVNIYDGDKILVGHEGEFSLLMSNYDSSVKDEVLSWKGSTYDKNDDQITLKKDTYSKELDANISIRVNYEIINSNVIKKTVTLFQPSIPNLYYTLIQNNIPPSSPKQYVTFEHEDFPGGFVHELFPAAGFVTPENQVNSSGRN